MKEAIVEIVLGGGETLTFVRTYNPYDLSTTTTVATVQDGPKLLKATKVDLAGWLGTGHNPITMLQFDGEPWAWYGKSAWFGQTVLIRQDTEPTLINEDPHVEHKSSVLRHPTPPPPYHLRELDSTFINRMLDYATITTVQGNLLNPHSPDDDVILLDPAAAPPMAVMVEETTANQETAADQIAAEESKAAALEPILTEMDAAGCPINYYPTWLHKQGMTDVQYARTLYAATRENPRVGLYPLVISPPGMGKTIFINAAFGLGVRKISCTVNTEEREVLGASKYESDGLELKEVFVPEALLLAFTHRHDESCPDPCGAAVALIDEGDMLDPQVATMLHPFADGSPTVTYRGITFRRSPDFFICLTGNGEDAPGSFISDAMWSRLPIKISWSISLSTCERLGIRKELRDFTANLLVVKANADPTLAIPAIRDLLAAERVWQVLGEFDGWNTLLGATRTASQDQWLREMGVVAGDAMYEDLKVAGGRVVVSDN